MIRLDVKNIDSYVGNTITRSNNNVGSLTIVFLDFLVFLSLSLLCLVSFGCSTSYHKLDENQAYWFNYDATKRGGILLPNTGKYKVVSEPSPDVVMNELSKLLLDGSYQLVSGGVQTDFQRQAVELGKRSITVMFLRESLFRLVELSINRDISEIELLKRYDKVIEAAKELALADRDAVRTTLAKELSQCPENVRYGLLKQFEREDDEQNK